MTEYLFDINLNAALRINAPSEAEARAMLVQIDALDICVSGLGMELRGECSLADDDVQLAEINGNEVPPRADRITATNNRRINAFAERLVAAVAELPRLKGFAMNEVILAIRAEAARPEYQEPSIVPLLELSTAHLSPATRGLIEMQTDDIPVFHEKGEYGWWFPVLAREFWPHTMPDDLKGVLVHAESLGVSWVMFDRDCDEIEALPTWDDMGHLLPSDLSAEDRENWLEEARDKVERRKAAREADADDYGLGAELDMSILSEPEARAAGAVASEAARWGLTPPGSVDPIAELAEIISPNISEAIRTMPK